MRMWRLLNYVRIIVIDLSGYLIMGIAKFKHRTQN